MVAGELASCTRLFCHRRGSEDVHNATERAGALHVNGVVVIITSLCSSLRAVDCCIGLRLQRTIPTDRRERDEDEPSSLFLFGRVDFFADLVQLIDQMRPLDNILNPYVILCGWRSFGSEETHFLHPISTRRRWQKPRPTQVCLRPLVIQTVVAMGCAQRKLNVGSIVIDKDYINLR